MDLQMRTAGPGEIVVDCGHQFDYYDEVRKVLERAAIDIFIVDPYIGRISFCGTSLMCDLA
jgi:hypothetical protein